MLGGGSSPRGLQSLCADLSRLRTVAVREHNAYIQDPISSPEWYGG